MIAEPVVASTPHVDGTAAPVGPREIGPGPRSRGRAFQLRALGLAGLILGSGVASGIGLYHHDRRPATEELQVVENWIKQGEYGRAEQALRNRVRLSPNDGTGRMMLARALAARGDLESCTRALHQVPQWTPQKAEALFREGQTYLLMNRAREAEAAFLAAIGADLLHPADPAVFHDASQELLSLYATENRWDDARKILWRLYDRATPAYRPTVLAMRLQCELERIAPTESVKLLSRYVAADSADWEARRALANAEFALGHESEALRHMRACLEARPVDPRVWRDDLTMLQTLGEIDAFNASLAQVPAAAETEPDLWIFRGEARERAGDWSTAAAHYRRAVALKPNLAGAHYRLAMVEGRIGHTTEAAAHRKRWQDLLAARSELRQAFVAYVEAQQRLPNDSTELRASLERLASICGTLGWSRSAAGWSRLSLP